MAARFNLTIKLGNDAMQTGADVQRALSELATNYGKLGGIEAGETGAGVIYDDNGNRVGEWKVTK